MKIGAPLGIKVVTKFGKLLLLDTLGNALFSELGEALGNKLGSSMGIAL
jgi:hypothetical protein